MAILAGLLGFVGRFAGKVLTTTLGWAAILLFGRVPADRQIVLALITFGSVVWAALAIGVILPYVGAFLVAAVPAPGLIDESWLRLGMLIGALVVPAVVGIATIFVVEPARRPTGFAIVQQVLRGYPLSAAMAITLVILALVGIARFVHHLALRWTDAHVPVVVRPGGYERVVADLERALDDAGLAVDRRPAPGVLSVPGKLLGSIAGPGMRSLVPEELVQLIGVGLEVGLYTSDIAMSGDRTSVARARAAIASRLLATEAYLTTSAEAHEIEARLESLARARVAGGEPGAAAVSDGDAPPVDVPAELRSIDQALAVLTVPHDEWEVLYRLRLQVERDLLAGSRPGGAFPGSETMAVAPDRNGERGTAGDGLPDWLPGLIAAGGIVLTAADVALAVAERRRKG
jgi:hypothetical protein